VAARERALNFCVGNSGASPATLEHTQTTQGEGGRAAVLGERNAGPGSQAWAAAAAVAATRGQVSLYSPPNHLVLFSPA